MRKILALVAREIRAQVYSPVAWVVWTLFLFVAGWMFIGIVHQFLELVDNYTAYAQYMSNSDILDRINLNELVVSGLFGNLLVIFVFLIPALTMRSFAEERRAGTDELLLTAPVGPGQLVAGKYLGLLAVAEVLVAGAGFYVLVLLHYGNPETGPIFTGLVGLALAVAALTALGFAISALTKSQVVAAVGSFVLFLLLFVVSWPAESAGGLVRQILLGLSLPAHYDGFAKGAVSSTDIAYFVSLTALGLFAARTTIASQRWR
jgi:gliding motility-associated transport system permease protein